jgi:hypothetical protein
MQSKQLSRGGIKMSNINEMLQGIETVGTKGWDAIKAIGKFLNYLMHPSLIFQGLWHATHLYAFWICLFIALLSAIAYGFGFKNFAKYIPASMAVYTLIKMIASAF